MSYPDFTLLPSFNGKKYDINCTLAYEAFAVNFFLNTNITEDKKYSIYQVAAICGNLQQESEFNPCISGDMTIPGHSNGIGQWNGQRNLDMIKFVEELFHNMPYKTMTDQAKFWGQLHFVDHEIKLLSYKAALNVLINHETDSDLAGKFGHIYEGFGDNSSLKRDSFAKAIVYAYKAGKYTSKVNSILEDIKDVSFLKYREKWFAPAGLSRGLLENKTDIPELRLVKPVTYNVDEFTKFLSGLNITELQWKPKFITLHNTAIPTMMQYLAYSQATKAQWPENLNNMYKRMGWHSDVHLVVTPNSTIINLCNLLQDGVHASCFNHTSIGIEMVGDFEKEDFNSGPGLEVQDTAITLLALLHNKFGWTPLPYEYNVKGLHFHKECIADHHPCPGKGVVKADLIAKIEAKMKELKA